ncbi:peptidylprolyl isomerase [Caldimonas brevitalea]|uniref:peptidylprolyl isomerase n=1 Tax=Caldimonas brevitalea TaxID=413882 RepID=A0A0G3BQH0_9BURK|nr:peptidylprolyl isomerase [Caldimonas brevitalea]AKJ30238.1 peptidyl-prolyl cis-trans isomerase C [Caldimonas brevitalea]
MHVHSKTCRGLTSAALAALLCWLALAVPAWAAGDANPPGAAGTAVAKVNGVGIERSLLDALLQARQGVPNPYEEAAPDAKAAPTPEDREAALRDLVMTEVLVQAAAQRGLHQRPEVAAELELQRKTLLAQQLVREIVAEVRVEPAEIEQRYRERPPQYEYKVSHVLLPDEAAARATIAQLQRGARFAAVAKARSTDTRSRRNGELGWLMLNQLEAPFAAALQSLGVGEYTREPVQTPYGWHVVLLQGRRELPRPSLDSMRAVLREELLHEKVQGRLAALQRQAAVELNVGATARMTR